MVLHRALVTFVTAASIFVLLIRAGHATPAVARFAWDGGATLDGANLAGSFQILLEYDTNDIQSSGSFFSVVPTASTVMGDLPPLEAQVPLIDLEMSQFGGIRVFGVNGGLGLFGIDLSSYDLSTSFGPEFGIPDPFGDWRFPTSGGLFGWAGGSPVQVDVVVGDAGPGGSPANPILPDSIGPDGEFVFSVDADSLPVDGNGGWFDPPTATGYRYTMSGGEFIGVAPPDDPAVVDDDDDLYGLHSMNGDFALDPTLGFPASEHDFVANGGAVTNFLIDGISVGGVGLDPADPMAFPAFLRINLTAGSATLTMTPIPEPNSLVLAMLCLVGPVAASRCQRPTASA